MFLADSETDPRATAVLTVLSQCFAGGLKVEGHHVERFHDNHTELQYVIQIRCEKLLKGMAEWVLDSVGSLIVGCFEVSVIEGRSRSSTIIDCDVRGIDCVTPGVLRLKVLARNVSPVWPGGEVREVCVRFLAEKAVIKVRSDKHCVLIP